MIYSDNFQSYAIGALSPFGSLTTIGFGPSIIVNDPPGIFGKSKCVYIPVLDGLKFDNSASYLLASSTFFGARFSSWNGVFAQFYNDSTVFGHLENNLDGTISFFFNNTRIITSEISLKLSRWNWFQVNLSYSNVGGFVSVSATIAVDQVIIINVTYLSNISVASLVGLGINIIQFTNFYFAELTIDNLQSIGTDPNPGSPSLKITQGINELHAVPDSSSLRFSQGINEVQVVPNTAQLRFTQGIIELYVSIQSSQGWQIYEA